MTPSPSIGHPVAAAFPSEEPRGGSAGLAGRSLSGLDDEPEASGPEMDSEGDPAIEEHFEEE
jgi:hypothetical protein